MAVLSRNVVLAFALAVPALVGCAALVGLDKKYDFTDDAGGPTSDADTPTLDGAGDSSTNPDAGPTDAASDRRPPACTLATATIVSQSCKNCLSGRCDEPVCLCQAAGNNCRLSELPGCVDQCRRDTPDASLVQCLTNVCQRNSATNLAAACIANTGCFDRCF